TVSATLDGQAPAFRPRVSRLPCRRALLGNPVAAAPGHTVSGLVVGSLLVDAPVDHHRQGNIKALDSVALGEDQRNSALPVIFALQVIKPDAVCAVLAGLPVFPILRNGKPVDRSLQGVVGAAL